MAERCAKWMPRADTRCVRPSGHPGYCESEQSMAAYKVLRAERQKAAGRGDLATRRRWARTSRLVRYGLTEVMFNQLLEAQGGACAMCGGSFEENKRICIDHDHACCPSEQRSCGQCIRGLLCLSCNTTLGHIERNYERAQLYLANQPGRILRAA